MKIKNAAKKILFLPVWLVAIFVCFSAHSLVYVFKKGIDNSVFSIVIYVFSFYTLTVLSVVIYRRVPSFIRKIRTDVHKNKYTNRYFTDVHFKNSVNLVISLVFNLIYVAVNAVSSAVYGTYWFAIFAVYYGIMAVMRFMLLMSAKRKNTELKRKSELKVARLCACILFTVNLFLAGAVLMMLYFDRGFSYRGFLIYVVALYSFYLVVSSIVDMIRYKKYNSPLMSVSKIIRFTSALVSMLTLETAMFSQFGKDTPIETQKIMIAATGAGISIVIIAMAVHIIVKTTKELKRHHHCHNIDSKALY